MHVQSALEEANIVGGELRQHYEPCTKMRWSALTYFPAGRGSVRIVVDSDSQSTLAKIRSRMGRRCSHLLLDCNDEGLPPLHVAGFPFVEPDVTVESLLHDMGFEVPKKGDVEVVATRITAGVQPTGRTDNPRWTWP